MSLYEMIINQKPRKLIMFTANAHKNAQGHCKPKTTVELPKNIKFYLAKDETSPRLECQYAVKTDIDQSQINNLQPFTLYLDCQNNHYEVDLLGTSTFKPIPYSQWIKNKTQ